MTADRSRWIALYVLCVGMLMIVLDVTVVNVALPSIQDDLGWLARVVIGRGGVFRQASPEGEDHGQVLPSEPLAADPRGRESAMKGRLELACPGQNVAKPPSCA